MPGDLFGNVNNPSPAVSFNMDDLGSDRSTTKRTFTFTGPIPVKVFDPNTNQYVMGHVDLTGKDYTHLNEIPGYESKISLAMGQLSTNAARAEENASILMKLEEETGAEFLTLGSKYGGYRKGAITQLTLQAMYDSAGGRERNVNFILKQHSNVLHVGVPHLKPGEAYLHQDQFGRTIFGTNIIHSIQEALDNDADRGQLLELIVEREGNQVGRFLLGTGKDPHYKVVNNLKNVVDYSPEEALNRLAPVSKSRMVSHLKGAKALKPFARDAEAFQSAVGEAGQMDAIGLIVDKLRTMEDQKYRVWLETSQEARRLSLTPGNEFMLKMMYTQETGGSFHQLGFMTKWDILGLKAFAGRKGRIDFTTFKNGEDYQRLIQNEFLGERHSSYSPELAKQKEFYDKLMDEVLTSKVSYRKNTDKVATNRKAFEKLSSAEKSEIQARIEQIAQQNGTTQEQATEFFFRSFDLNFQSVQDLFKWDGTDLRSTFSAPIKASTSHVDLARGRKILDMMTEGVGLGREFSAVQITPLSYVEGEMPALLKGKSAAHIQFRKWDPKTQAVKALQLLGGNDTAGYVLPTILEQANNDLVGLSGSQAFTAELSNIFLNEDQLRFGIKGKKYSIFGERKMFEEGEVFHHTGLSGEFGYIAREMSQLTGVSEAQILAASKANGSEIRQIVDKYLMLRTRHGIKGANTLTQGKVFSIIRERAGEFALQEQSWKKDLVGAPLGVGAEQVSGDFLANAFNFRMKTQFSSLDDNLIEKYSEILSQSGFAPVFKGLKNAENFITGFRGVSSTLATAQETGTSLSRWFKAFRQNSGGVKLSKMNVMLSDFDTASFAKIVSNGVVETKDLRYGEGFGVLTASGTRKVMEDLTRNGIAIDRFGKIQTNNGGLKLVPQTALSEKTAQVGNQHLNVDAVVAFDELLKHDEGASIVGRYLREAEHRRTGKKIDLNKMSEDEIGNLIQRHSDNDGNFIMQDFDDLYAPQSSAERTTTESTLIAEAYKHHRVEKIHQSEMAEAPQEIHNLIKDAMHALNSIDSEFPVLDDATLATRIQTANHKLSSHLLNNERFRHSEPQIIEKNFEVIEAIGPSWAREMIEKGNETNASQTSKKMGRLLGILESHLK